MWQNNCLVVSTYPSEKYEFVSWDYVTFPIYGKIENDPNQQPDSSLRMQSLETHSQQSQARPISWNNTDWDVTNWQNQTYQNRR